ncbi:MAG: ABC transporter permease, partial [Planctomycetota bacterium]
MYRWLLCFRYLRTRYIALASIISVTLGVATLIVVNSVMAGFSAEMHERLHGLASDIVIECHAPSGMPDPEAHLAEIDRIVGSQIAGTSYSVRVPAMLHITYNGRPLMHQVNLVGIDPSTYDGVSHFGRYLMHPENRERVSFDLRNDGYGADRPPLDMAGWGYRKQMAAFSKEREAQRAQLEALTNKDTVEMDGPKFGMMAPTELTTDAAGEPINLFDPAIDQHFGIVLGIATCNIKRRYQSGEVEDVFYARPGDDVKLMFPNASEETKVINQSFTVVDLYESGMSEYDSSFAFCRLDTLQELRGMIDPQSATR